MTPAAPQVVHLTEAALGGVLQHVAYIVPALGRLGFRQHLIISPDRGGPDFDGTMAAIQQSGCSVHRHSMAHTPSPLRDMRSLGVLRGHLAATGPAILHTHATKAGLLGRLACGSAPVVHTPHAFVTHQLRSRTARWIYVQLERVLSLRTARYVFVSEAEASLGRSRFALPARKLRVVENGLPARFARELLNRNQARKALGIPTNQTALLFTGRFAYQKGLDWLLRALPGALAGFPGCHLWIAGDGELSDAHRSLAAAMGLDNRITWLGYRPDISQHLRGFDLAVLPSRYESLPYFLLEAVASGIPVLVSDIPANFPRPNWHRALRVARVDDVDDLARAIRETLAARDPRATTSATELIGDFTLDRQAAGLAEIYREVATEARLPGPPA